MEASFFVCVPTGLTYNTEYITLQVEHITSTQSSYALLLDYKSIAQPFIKNPAQTMYTSGFQLPHLTPEVLEVFFPPRPTPAFLLEVRFKKKSTLGLLRAENY